MYPTTGEWAWFFGGFIPEALDKDYRNSDPRGHTRLNEGREICLNSYEEIEVVQPFYNLRDMVACTSNFSGPVVFLSAGGTECHVRDPILISTAKMSTAIGGGSEMRDARAGMLAWGHISR